MASHNGLMELSQLVADSSVSERLSYVRVLLDLMEGREDVEQRALTGGAAIWLTAIDETLMDGNPEVRGTLYKDRRASEEGGRTIRGLRLARNEIAHGSALVTRNGVRFPASFPWRFYLHFISANELSAHNRLRRGSELRAFDLSLYEQHVAGQRPREVLARGHDWLVEITGV